MVRCSLLLLFAALAPPGDTPAPDSAALSVCELSKDLASFRNKVVTVRGVYYYGLRQECPQKCASGLWPSFINLEGATDATWAALAKADKEVEAERNGPVNGSRFG
jgi:hypothetical protein